MIGIQATRVLDAPHDKVWNLISDLRRVKYYHPKVRNVHMLSPNKQGLGATRVCHFHDGTQIREEVTEADDEHIHMILSDYSVPFKKFSADLHAVPLQDGSKTQVSMTMHYQVKYGPLGYLMGITVMPLAVRSLLNNVLAGMEYHLETGKTVDQDFQPSKQFCM